VEATANPSRPGSIVEYRRKRLLAVGRNGDLMSFGLEIETQSFSDVLLVFDDEYSTHGWIAAGIRESGFGIRFMKQGAAIRA
jgi:hypothetical protein